MKTIKLILGVFILSCTVSVYAQFDKPQLQLGIGINEPYTNLKGTYYTNEILGSFYVLEVNPDFMTSNYGGKTGLNFFGKGKINFDKYSTVRGVLSATFATFNTFEPSQSGNIGVEVININNQLDTVITSITTNYTFNNFIIEIENIYFYTS